MEFTSEDETDFNQCSQGLVTWKYAYYIYMVNGILLFPLIVYLDIDSLNVMLPDFCPELWHFHLAAAAPCLPANLLWKCNPPKWNAEGSRLYYCSKQMKCQTPLDLLGFFFQFFSPLAGRKRINATTTTATSSIAAAIQCQTKSILRDDRLYSEPKSLLFRKKITQVVESTKSNL